MKTTVDVAGQILYDATATVKGDPTYGIITTVPVY